MSSCREMASVSSSTSSMFHTGTSSRSVYNPITHILHILTGSKQYALTAMQNLMELDYGWSNLDNSFILKVVQILSSESPINVCRPATAILKKLVEADPGSASGVHAAGSSKGPPSPPSGSVYRYGFDVVYEQMRKEQRLLETVVSRLGSADTTMALYRFVYAL